jgi:serine-type D-Ala-D-Ala carboxypeptidase/endopeptidase (penicillin-binding protein 4)
MRPGGPSRTYRGLPRSLAGLALLLLLVGLLPGLPGELEARLQAQTTLDAPAPAHPLQWTTRVDPGVATRVEAVLSRPFMDRVHWGVFLLDPSEGTVLYERNPDLPFVPASNMKVPVTWAALELLGPAHRFRTVLHAAAPPREGVVQGDLVLRGNGDPSLGEPFHRSADAALEALARRVTEAGVRRVEGALVVDASAWDSTSVPTGWLVGNLPGRPAATGGAFSVGNGVLEVEVTGGTAAGSPARVAWRPLGTADFVESRVRTVGAGGPAEVEALYLPESRRWVLEGTLPPGARRTLIRAQRDPVRQAAHGLLRALEGEGVSVRDGVRLVWDRDVSPTHGVEVARMESPPLMELVRAILEPSQNWMTEQLVRALGELHGEEGSWEEGFGVIARQLEQELGVDSLDVHFRDGSGLAGYNLITPRALTRILAQARARPWGQEYRAAMATPGSAEGTLTNRLHDLRGRVFAKTGSITHVNTLSGYLETVDGRELIFVVLTNAGNQPAGRIRAGIDDVVRAMALHRQVDR